MMKMAKASKADMDMALQLCSALEAVDRRFFPEGCADVDDPDDFDIDDDEHCGRVLRHIHGLMQAGSIGRVIWGMYVVMDPNNEIVDPAATTLELHPSIAQDRLDARRYRSLRRGQAWSVIDGIGDVLPGRDGAYRHELLCDFRLGVQTELFARPVPTGPVNERLLKAVTNLLSWIDDYAETSDPCFAAVEKHAQDAVAEAEKINDRPTGGGA